MTAPSVRESLAELVACKDLKDMLDLDFTPEYIAQHGAELADMRAEYDRRKPLAWSAARAALQSPGVSERDATFGALLRVSSWIAHAPHSDNCFVSNHYAGDPGNQCNCGKDSVLGFVDAAIARERGRTRELHELLLEAHGCLVRMGCGVAVDCSGTLAKMEAALASEEEGRG